MNSAILDISHVSKRFTLHNQGGVELTVLDNANLIVHAGECVVLNGPSGMGKSTLLKLVFANYRASSGSIMVRQTNGSMIDLTTATPQQINRVRTESISYVSQFLRVIPRLSALDIVMEPLLITVGSHFSESQAKDKARDILSRLRLPERLWHLPPATFSGGEQQRVNIARNMIRTRSLLLLDEPTAALDTKNKDTVVAMVHEARSNGCAVVGVFHDQAVCDAVATRYVNVADYVYKKLDGASNDSHSFT
jgi:alpha-D-ribose 1-methylphosphonate 5-triphosphate synthase subunit PhnL